MQPGRVEVSLVAQLREDPMGGADGHTGSARDIADTPPPGIVGIDEKAE